MKRLLSIILLLTLWNVSAQIPATIGSGYSRPAGNRLVADNINQKLFAHWKLEETGSGARADSFDSHSLAANTGIGNAAGKINNAVDLSGSSQYLFINSSPLQFGDTSFTFTGWVFFDVLASGIPVISQTATSTKSYVLFSDGTVLKWSVSADGSTFAATATSTVTLSTGTWYFFRCWHDSVLNQIGIAVNTETEVTTAHSTGTYIDPGGNSFNLGYRNDTVQYLNGRIDSVTCWTRALPTSYHSTLYNNGSGLDYPFP